MITDQSSIPSTIGGYKIDKKIGAGGQSEVFTICTTEDQPALALKWSRQSYDPPWSDPLTEEYRILSTLNHPHPRQARNMIFS